MWSEYQYLTSSPESVHYAFKGYFDKENDLVSLLRKVALFSSQRSSDEFNKAWPSNSQKDQVKKVWGSKDEIDEFRKKVNDAWAKR